MSSPTWLAVSAKSRLGEGPHSNVIESRPGWQTARLVSSSNGSVSFFHLSALPDGNVLAIGTRDSASGYDDVFFQDWSPEGVFVSEQEYGTPVHDEGFWGTATATGDTWIVGRTQGTFPGNAALGQEDTFVTRIDSTGTIQWTKQVGSTADETLARVAVDSSGRSFVAAGTYGSVDGHAYGGAQDVFVMSFDASGNEMWSQQIATAGDESIAGVVLDPSGDPLVVGTTGGSLGGQTNLGSTDVFSRNTIGTATCSGRSSMVPRILNLSRTLGSMSIPETFSSLGAVVRAPTDCKARCFFASISQECCEIASSSQATPIFGRSHRQSTDRSTRLGTPTKAFPQRARLMEVAISLCCVSTRTTNLFGRGTWELRTAISQRELLPTRME